MRTKRSTASLHKLKSIGATDNAEFQNRIVWLIETEKKPELAISELSKHYSVETPKLKVGLPKGEKKALGCYVRKSKCIHIADYKSLYSPYVIIHEFYHHLRSVTGSHRGTERHAENFAVSFLALAARQRNDASAQP